LRFIKSLILVVVLCVVAAAAEPVRMLPDQVANFRYSAPTKKIANPESGVSFESAEYAGAGGSRVLVEAVQYPHDSKAYEAFSIAAASAQAQINTDYGTAGFARDNDVAFFKGSYFVRLRNLKGDAANLKALAQELANLFDKGENDIPALIKHLPNPDEAQKTAVFLHSFANLDQLQLQQGVLSAIDSRGNADAAFAAYGPSKVLIVEFNTPQLAKENDDRITARIQELWKLGQPAPKAYRRVGNYSVFVFDAPDDATAKQLVDQIKYEQVVSWLGENPNILKQAQEHYVNTTLGVLVAVLKASGYALLACLGIGGLAGALLFTHRRAQQQKNQATSFSDAGGMLRLNLDELTPQTDPARLLSDRN
jgi:hypothetical protein